ncbi:MAG: flavin reductase family protein [Pseudomonadota bacterium]
MGMERDQFISAMRRVASSVTVVTTDGPAGRHGATVSAFCSVSADPPMVLVCLNANSKMAETVKHNRRFNINILPLDGLDLAARFCGSQDHLVSNRFDNIDTLDAEVPAFPGATVLSCNIDQSIPSGSHQIMMGLVTETRESNAAPLTYFDGAYHGVSPLAQTLEG